MPYRESIFGPKNYYHVFNRGNEKKNIFLEPVDYERFISKIDEYKTTHEVSIICYCLMPNHFHFLLKQNTKDSISSFIHRLTVSYSMYFNKRYKRVGHLFQGSFRAKLIKNDEYLLHLSRYIHLNPTEILTRDRGLEKYIWSSYPEYLGITNKDICEKTIILQQFRSADLAQSYQNFVENITVESGPFKSEDFVM